MGHRIVKRVPLDFDAPLNETYAGYVMPAEIRPSDCTDCEGSGYGQTARWLRTTFYAHNVGHPVGGWGDKLVQADVDALVEAGRLRQLRHREPTEDNPCTHEWVMVPRTAEEVNAAQRAPWGMDLHSHDDINVSVLVRSRCERLGADHECSTCNGHGLIGTPEQIDAYENWTGTEPPEGGGWQMWETTTEGSPQTPVFATAEELADYCAVHCTVFADMRWTVDEWLASLARPPRTR